MNNNVCLPITYFVLTQDPVHVGVGGYRLGHVDNAIMRDPATNLPKIPGSSLSGVARAYVAMLHGNEPTTNNRTRLDCAGKGGEHGEKHCGDPDCPVCIPFGFSKGEGNKSLHGMAQFFDTCFLFFPIHSLTGPVWITSPEVLTRAKMKKPPKPAKNKIHTSPNLAVNWDNQKMLSLGWFFIEVEKDLPSPFTIPGLPETDDAIQTILSRLVVVPDDIFGRLVNDHLEIRTSVSINPRTGAAEEGALFTYEAIPRGTVLFFDIAYNNPLHFQINKEPIAHDIPWVRTQVESAFPYFESLGVGGMNTRGMGRLRIISSVQEDKQ